MKPPCHHLPFQEASFIAVQRKMANTVNISGSAEGFCSRKYKHFSSFENLPSLKFSFSFCKLSFSTVNVCINSGEVLEIKCAEQQSVS